jgi:hypothetical protein
LGSRLSQSVSRSSSRSLGLKREMSILGLVIDRNLGSALRTGKVLVGEA